MSFDASWEVDKYKEDHESNDHWLLRKAFMERWKNDYPEERLVCLARVFANMEFMGCRYPIEVMQEVARLSRDVAQQYRNSKKTKLQRTFVSASDAAEDRARGVKREGGKIKEAPAPKNSKILFVPQSTDNNKDVPNNETIKESIETPDLQDNKPLPMFQHQYDYIKDLSSMKCLDVSSFTEKMFETEFGRMILFIRPWTSKISNIQASCQTCRVPMKSTYEDNCLTLYIRNTIVAQAYGLKNEAKKEVEKIAWNRLREQVASIVIKEQWIEGERVSVGDVTMPKQREFGKPVEPSVAIKMMKLMGWEGGGLGVEAQGIEEPIKPHFQMVNRAGLGSGRDQHLSGDNLDRSHTRHLRQAGHRLMMSFLSSDAIDVDLVFSSEFSKEERAILHQTAQKIGLASKSYGNVDRFLVVKKKVKPFALFEAVVEKGGNTAKYQVFLPVALANKR